MAVHGSRTDEGQDSGIIGKHTTARRPRVALACQRCKSRKQKCDGIRPSCSTCVGFEVICKYIKPSRLLPRSHDTSLAAAEARVAELEAILSREGIVDEGESQWRRRQTSQSPDAPKQIPVRSSMKRPHVETIGPEHEINGAEEDDESRRTDFSSVFDVLRDLSLEASSGYIGASSSITMGRMVGSLVKGSEPLDVGSPDHRQEEHLTSKSMSDTGSDDHCYMETATIPQDIADKLLKGYLKHISTRWPILPSAYIRSLHSRRASLIDSFERCTLHLVYASGGRFLETTGETGTFYCERHHATALQYLDELVQCHDLRSVQVLILLAIYSLRAPRGPGAWTYVGLAMRACIELGMHRKSDPKGCSLFENEMRKRIFWTCYCLDRQISIILGRPFAISDRDIDVELPLDVNESVQDSATLASTQGTAATINPNQAPIYSTSLSCFIHICRLRRIESNIQQSIYRVDQTSGVSEVEVESFVRQLEDWKEEIPCDARQHSADKATTRTDTMVIDGYGYYMVYYYKCLRFLLYPLLSVPNTSLILIKKCAEACRGVCDTYKMLHQNIPVGFSLMALHSVFLAGLTLVYCNWIAPHELFNMSNSNAMNACSIVLYIITERWPGAKKYRDMYEELKQSVLEAVEENGYEPRRAAKRLNLGLFSTFTRNEGGRAQVTRMVSDMTGVSQPPEIESPITSDIHNFPVDMSSQLHTSALDVSRQATFDPSLSLFQDFDLANGFDIGDVDTGPIDYEVNF